MDLRQSAEWQKAQKGELYLAFVPELIDARERCNAACMRFNTTTDLSRRNLVKLWRDIVQDPEPIPAPLPTAAEDDVQFKQDPWVLPPLHMDYGFNVHLGSGVFLNFNATFVDTCSITIGARTLVGPNCSFYSGSHPVDPAIRMGTEGPESGKPIEIGEDCWLGGNVVILPGIKIGRGSTIGAGSVVTKDVPPFHIAAGNPARILRKVDTSMDTGDTEEERTAAATGSTTQSGADGPEVAMAEDAFQQEQQR